jgi:hypothetical protein
MDYSCGPKAYNLQYVVPNPKPYFKFLGIKKYDMHTCSRFKTKTSGKSVGLKN